MTKDDIVNWAYKAGFLIDTHAQQYQPNCVLSTHGFIDENLERFANLVAAAQKEADAKLIEEYPYWIGANAKSDIAAAIRGTT